MELDAEAGSRDSTKKVAPPSRRLGAKPQGRSVLARRADGETHVTTAGSMPAVLLGDGTAFLQAHRRG